MYFTGKDYTEYLDKVVKFKQFIPKYPLLEVFFSNMEGTKMKMGGFGPKRKFDKFREYRVLSSCNYNDTKTTSVNLLLEED